MRTTGPLLLLACSLTACSGEPGSQVVPGTLPETNQTEDTGWTVGDIANWHIAYHGNTGKATATVVASSSQPGFLNYSQCALLGTPCISGFPSKEDDWKDIDLDQEIDRCQTETRFLGFEIAYGPYTLEYKEDPECGFGGYMDKDIDLDDLPVDRWVGETWGGQWKEYSSDRDLFVSRPIEVLNPAAGENLTFTNGQKVPLEWVPTGEGTVALLVSTRFGLARLFHLEDDGFYELDVDNDLGLTNNEEELTFTFMRWNVETLRTYGHVIDLVASSDWQFTAQYYNIGAREKIEPADRCDEAAGLPALPAGDYWGWLGNKDDDLSVGLNCLDPAVQNPAGAAAAGKDGIVRIEVPPYNQVAVDYNVYDESASAYLVRDCSDPVDTCLDGSDLQPDKDQHEYLSYFNLSDDTESLYIVADEWQATNSVFTLDLTINELSEPDMYDACGGANGADAASPTVVTNDYFAQFTGWAGDMNPGAGGCTGTSLSGAEAVTPIEVGPGLTLTASVSMVAGSDKDPGLYILTQCSNLFSCVAGADVSLDTDETVIWKNTDPAQTATVYLVVDSKNGLDRYFLSVSVQ